MDGPKILEVIQIYRKHFTEKGIGTMDFPHESLPGSKQEILAHCHGMLDEMESFVSEGRIEKAFRWLGFIQGCLWSTGQYSLEELKNHNRPSAEKEFILRVSDFVPNKEVAELDIPCVRCGKKPAEWSAAKPSENEAKCRATALCLECRLAWHNYNPKESLDLWCKIRGRLAAIFWMAIFIRFAKGLSPLDRAGSEKLLNECRKRVRAKK